MSRRIDFEKGDLDSAGEVDDLAISGSEIQMLRLERMDTGHVWGAIYFNDGSEVRLSFHSKGRLSMTAESQ